MSHSYVFEAARKNVPRRVRVPVRLKPAGGTGVFTDPQRFLRRDAARRTPLGRPSRVDRHEVRSLSLALVLEQREERPPRRRRRVSTVRRRFYHPVHIQVFDRYKVILPSVVVREFVQEVTALPLEVAVTLRDPPPLLLVVGRAVLLPREFLLLAFQSLSFLGEVERPDRRTVRVVSVLQNPYIDTDALLGVLRRFGQFTVHFDTERGEPLARRFLLDRDLFEVGVVGDVAVEPYRDVRKFRERQHSLTALLVELEARLTVRETAELSWWLPLELTDAVSVLLERGESFQIVEQPLYDGLENLRVHVREAVPPLLEDG